MTDEWGSEQGQIIGLIKIYQFPLARHPHLRVARECVWVTSRAWGAFTATHRHPYLSVAGERVWVTSTACGAFTATHRHLLKFSPTLKKEIYNEGKPAN